MSKLLVLLKTYGKLYIGAFNRKKNKGELISGGALLGVISVIFVVLFTSMSMSTIEQFLKLEERDIISPLYVLTATGLIFMFLIVVLKGTSFKKSNDFDLLMSLPIKKSIVVLSKILKDYLFDLLALLLIMLPGYVCYYFMVEEASFLVVIFGIIVIVLLTFLSNSIAILLNLIISKITRRLRNAEIIQTLISVFITLCFIIFYFIFNMSLMNAPDLVENLYKFYPLKLVVSALAFSDVISLLILCAICIVPFIIAVFFEVLDFNHPVNKVNNSKKELTYNKRSVMFHLFKNESKRYFKSTIYVLNTIIGAFFILLSSALMTGFGKERIESIITMYLPNVDNLLAHINAIIVMIVSVTSSTVITTSASISIEGKHFWILKAHPIDVKDIFKAKMLLNILLGGIPSVIGAILLVFVVGISYLPFAVILMLSSVVFSAIIGLIFNLKYYNLDWKDEQEIVKQGMAVLISMAVAILPGAIILVAYLAGLMMVVNPYVYLAIACILMILVDVILLRYLFTKGIEKFKSIN